MSFDTWCSKTCLSNYIPIHTPQPSPFQYKALAALAGFASEHPQHTDLYTTRSDVLQRFTAMGKC